MRFSLKTLLSLFVTLCAGIGQSHAAELMYVTLSDGSTVTYDVSLSSVTDIENSKLLFRNVTYNWYGTGLVFDKSGNLYASSYAYDKIIITNPQGTQIGETSNTPYLAGPRGMAFDPSGNLYVANQFNTNGNFIAKFPVGSRFANVTQPWDVVSDSSGNIYVSSQESLHENIKKISPDGTVNTFVSGLIGVSGLAMDSSGYLYSNSYSGGNGIILKIAQDGTSSTFATRVTSDANDLTFDSAGYLYVANKYNHTISKFNSSGVLQFSWSTGTLDPQFLAVAPTSVPEPSTYALGAIASSVIAFAARRRKGLTIR